jgi:PST family polysaccharide transporter
MQPYRPSICLAAFHGIFKYSKWLFLNNMLVYLRLRAPDFIVGKLLGVSGLGLYSISYEISQLPTTELVAPVNRVLLPGLSKIAADPARLSAAFVRAASSIVLLSLPVAFGLAATAHLITPIALGHKWLAAIPIIKVLAIYGGFTAILSPISTTLLAIGKPSTVVLMSTFIVVIVLPSTYFATVHYGAIGTANAMMLSLLFMLPVYYAVATRAIGLVWRDVFGIFARPVLSTALMYLAVEFVFGHAAPTVVQLLLAISFGGATYLFSAVVLWTLAGKPDNCGESFVLEQVKSRLRRR